MTLLKKKRVENLILILFVGILFDSIDKHINRLVNHLSGLMELPIATAFKKLELVSNYMLFNNILQFTLNVETRSRKRKAKKII